MKACFLVYSWWLLTKYKKGRDFSHGGKGWESLWGLFHKADFIHEDSPLMAKVPPQIPFPSTITLRNRMSAYEFWGTINIQTIAGWCGSYVRWFSLSPFVAEKKPILTLCWNCFFDLLFTTFVFIIVQSGLPQRTLPLCLTPCPPVEGRKEDINTSPA